jgi:hypothetical protein
MELKTEFEPLEGLPVLPLPPAPTVTVIAEPLVTANPEAVL